MNPPPAVLRVADGVRRMVWRAAGPRTVGVRAIVVDADKRVLLVRHTYGSEQWHLPGGGVKRRESLVEALHRELREETGVVVDGPVRLHGAFSNLTEGKSDHIAVFVVDRYRREAGDSNEIAAAQFFEPTRLPDGASRGTRRRLDEWQRGEVTSFDW